jgi:putative tryptophan/tyrosine transport system substrate-binding protein
MRRREFIILLGSGVVAWPFGAHGQQEKLWRIGMLETISPALNAANLAAFRNGLRQLGYVEGQSYVIEYRSVEGRAARFPELASELVASKVDIIVTRGTPATLAAVTRIGFLNNMSNPVIPPQWEETKKAARSLGIATELLEVRSKEDIGRAFEAVSRSRVDGLLVGIDAVTQEHRKLIGDLARQQRVPTLCASREYVEADGFLSYGVSYPDLYRRAAGMVDKIFKGAKAGDLPVEQPVKLELIINLTTAKALGLTVPPALLATADEVIE